MIFTSLTVSVLAQAEPDTTFNQLFSRNIEGWIAGRISSSIDLPNGNTLWLMNESYIGSENVDTSFAPGTQKIRNCFIMQNGQTLTSMYGGTFENPSDFIQTNTPDSTWFYPEHGMVQDDTLMIFVSEYGPTLYDPNPVSFYRNCVVLYAYPDLTYLGYIELPYSQMNTVIYGGRILQQEDYTYIYGKYFHDYYFQVHLARTSKDNFLNPWEFWDGLRWKSFPQATSTIGMSGFITGVFSHEGKIVDIYSGIGIYSRTSDHPEQPFESNQLLYLFNLPFEYLPKTTPHPQFEENNSLLISYNIIPKDSINNVDIYRPKFIRVPFTMIDSTFMPSGINQNIPWNGDGVVIENIFPNPAQENITFFIHLEDAINLNLSFYDVLGKTLKSIPEKKYGAGEHSITLDIKDFPKGTVIYQICEKSGWFIHQ
jgi:hypothetical protein